MTAYKVTGSSPVAMTLRAPKSAVSDTRKLTATRIEVSDNTNVEVGVILGGEIRFRNALISGNTTAVSLFVQEFDSNYGKRMEVENATIVGSWYGVFWWNAFTNLSVKNTIIANHSKGALTGSTTSAWLSYSNVYGNVGGDSTAAAGGSNNSTTNPLFTNATTGDFTLASGSPAIHAGDALILNKDGTRSDMGAYGGPGAW